MKVELEYTDKGGRVVKVVGFFRSFQAGREHAEKVGCGDEYALHRTDLKSKKTPNGHNSQSKI